MSGGDFRGRTVLVTGGAGLIGQECVRQLLDQGAAVRATVFRERRLTLDHPRLEIVPCDLMERAVCAEIVRDVDVVIHAAAYVRGVKGREDAPVELVVNNLLPAVHVIEAVCRQGVERLGWIGSATVYPATQHPAREEDAFAADPLPKYFGVAWGQRYCEKLCQHLHETSRTKFALIRATAVYGPHERFTLEDGHVLPALMIKAANRLNPFPLWGGGEEIRDFVYVADLVRGLLATVAGYAVADPVNIGSGVGHRIKDALRVILDYEGYAPDVVYEGRRPTIGEVRLVDIGKAKRTLGFEPQTSLEAGLRRTIDWYRSTLARAGA